MANGIIQKASIEKIPRRKRLTKEGNERFLRQISCTAKKRYSKENTARMDARDMKYPLDHYRCRFCDGWHVGTIPKGLEGRKARKRPSDM